MSRRLGHAAAAAGVLAVMAAILAALGRAWWCAAGDAGLWSGDVLAYVVGWWLAGVLPVGTSVALFAVVDGVLMLWIRDSLLLNVLMLAYPLEAVRRWQTGGGS